MILTGTIVHGKHLGTSMGFPTANIAQDQPETALLPGVYAAEMTVDGYPKPMACMVNIGRHPTVPEGPPTVEAHVLDFDGNLYGRHATVSLLRYLRPEHRFSSVKDLEAQLGMDRLEVRAMFASGL